MKITLNNKKIETEEVKTILEVANETGIHIPTLCYLKLHNKNIVNHQASCRVCMVEVEGRNNLVPACSTNITDNMVIKTTSLRAIKARRTNLELLLSNHPKDCLTCPKNGGCELQALASQMGVRKINYEGKRNKYELDKSSFSVYRNKEKCILCGRCEVVCNDIQTVGVYSKINRGFDTIMTTAYDSEIKDSPCTYCGACVSVCPTAALTEADNTKEVWDALNNKEKTVVVQTAPAVRVALGELFGMGFGKDVTGKMITSLKELGFDKVYDTNFGADLTVMEETKEFLDRLEKQENLPILTSCCPSWINFIEDNFPDLLNIPSTCRSPHEMLGSMAKTYLAEKLNIKSKDIVVVSVMPCLAKKYESKREELKNNEISNVDYVITTRELAKMIKEAGIDFTSLKDSDFDSLLGESTGAAVIFGTTGGVIEAVIRNAYYIKTNRTDIKIDFKDLRELKGIRESTIDLAGTKLKIAVSYGLGNARKLLNKIKDGKSDYDAIEIMACPGGCIGGGGQPYYLGLNEDVLTKRREAIFKNDEKNQKRISSLNNEIKELYKSYLGEIGGKKAHELLHTTYKKKNRKIQ